jgi:hypothetical protein
MATGVGRGSVNIRHTTGVRRRIIKDKTLMSAARQVDKVWTLSEDSKCLRAVWQTMDFLAAVDFLRRIALISQNGAKRKAVHVAQAPSSPYCPLASAPISGYSSNLCLAD